MRDRRARQGCRSGQGSADVRTTGPRGYRPPTIATRGSRGRRRRRFTARIGPVGSPPPLITSGAAASGKPTPRRSRPIDLHVASSSQAWCDDGADRVRAARRPQVRASCRGRALIQPRHWRTTAASPKDSAALTLLASAVKTITRGAHAWHPGVVGPMASWRHQIHAIPQSRPRGSGGAPRARCLCGVSTRGGGWGATSAASPVSAPAAGLTARSAADAPAMAAPAGGAGSALGGVASVSGVRIRPGDAGSESCRKDSIPRFAGRGLVISPSSRCALPILWSRSGVGHALRKYAWRRSGWARVDQLYRGQTDSGVRLPGFIH